MRIDRISITNFRCFEDLQVECHPQLNVLVGVNGSGKTALLEALKLGIIGSIGELKEAVPQKTTATGYKFDPKKDPRTVVFERGETEQSHVVDITLFGTLGEKEEIWTRALLKSNVKYKHDDGFDRIKQYFSALDKAIQTNANVELPVFAYYSTGRLFLENNDTGIEINGKRKSGYINASTAKSSQYLFKKWYKNYQDGREKYQANNLKFDFSSFERVESLILEFVPGCKGLFYDNLTFREIVFVFDDGKVIPYSMLSDGLRNLVALISDLALRCAVLNPWMGATIHENHGVVLIDEIDLHLHPSWQRQVIPGLLKAFPNVQFFVTTHSPQVLSSVKRENVYVLDNNQVKSGMVFTEGRDSNSILQDAFGVSEMDIEDRKIISNIYTLIEKGPELEALEELKTLKEKRGENDREVQRITTFLDLA